MSIGHRFISGVDCTPDPQGRSALVSFDQVTARSPRRSNVGCCWHRTCTVSVRVNAWIAPIYSANTEISPHLHLTTDAKVHSVSFIVDDLHDVVTTSIPTGLPGMRNGPRCTYGLSGLVLLARDMSGLTTADMASNIGYDLLQF